MGKIEITNNRAATDDSIKMAQEYMDLAFDHIVNSYKVDIIGCRCIVFQEKSPYSLEDETILHIKLNINGKDYVSRVNIVGSQQTGLYQMRNGRMTAEYFTIRQIIHDSIVEKLSEVFTDLSLFQLSNGNYGRKV